MLNRPLAAKPLLSGIVVHWRDEEHLRELTARWPLGDPRFELWVVDNSGSAPALPPEVRLLSPARNLGFAGGANAGARASRGELLLFLNPDAGPEPQALDSLLDGFAHHPEAGGLAPRLTSPSGQEQWSWQLRRLPRLPDLLRQALVPGGSLEPPAEPPATAAVEQPAAAAWALRRSAFELVGGFDAGYFPAWMEDVDLAKRLAAAGIVTLYWPQARFRHSLGSTVAAVGYGPFLEILDRNTLRYVRKHHGLAAGVLLFSALALGSVARLLGSLFVAPHRAAGRGDGVRSQFVRLLHLPRGWRAAGSTDTG